MTKSDTLKKEKPVKKTGLSNKTKISFKVSARAGKLLGRENFSNPEGAIIELVKNAYDADAKNCFVFFDIPTKIKKENGVEYKVPIKEESSIFIIDNGEGMIKEAIEDHWMQIGTDNKQTHFVSDEKRIKTGAKGIGRFALDRLGFKTEMWTLSKKAKNYNGFFWTMDWNQFDESNKLISEITAELQPVKLHLKDKINSVTSENPLVKKAIERVNFSKGIIIKISNLKDDWFDKDIKGVFKSLEALMPPKELNISFEVLFKHLQQPDEFGKVETAFYNEYDYKLSTFFNADKLEVDFDIVRNELDLAKINKNFKPVFKEKKYPYNLKTLQSKQYSFTKPISKLLNWKLGEVQKKQLQELGSFSFTFYYLKLSNSKKEGYPYKKIVAKERKATLERFGGVKIYRDSFRVRPYGNPDNDWLGLGFRAAQSPVGPGQRIGDWRVRPASTAGIISISRKTNPGLTDKSDRSALQENDAFETFKSILIGIIHEFEVDRSKILNPFYLHLKKEKEKEKKEAVEKRAEELATKIIEQNKLIDYTKQINRTDSFEEALKLLSEMETLKISPDGITFTSLINKANTYKDALALLDKMKALKISPDEVTFNSLINKANTYKEALALLDKMQTLKISPDEVTFNSLINKANTYKEALALLDKMKALKISPDEVTFNSLINKANTYKEVLPLLDKMQTLKISHNEITFTSLINKANTYKEALTLLDKMQALKISPNEVTFNSLIKKANTYKEALALLDKMQTLKISSNEITFTSLINKANTYKEALALLDKMKALKIPPNEITFTSLINKVNTYKEALALLDKMKALKIPPNEITFTSLINKANTYKEALALLDKMKALKISPDEITFNSLINKANTYREALTLLDKMKALKIPPNEITFTSLINKANTYKEALALLNKMQVLKIPPDEITFNSLINKANTYKEALALLNKMQVLKIPPDEITFNSLINKANTYKEAQALLDKMKALKISPDEITFTSLINKANTYKEALTLLDKMKALKISPNEITFTSLINKANSYKEALALLDKMQTLKISPNEITFTSLINKANTYKEALALLDKMQTLKISPDEITFTSLINKANTYKEASLLLDKMESLKFQPKENIFRQLLKKSNSLQEASVLLDKMETLKIKINKDTFNPLISKHKSLEEVVTQLNLNEANTLETLNNIIKERIVSAEKESLTKVAKDAIKKLEETDKKAGLEEIAQVRALASLGLIVSSFAHELKEIKNNATEIKALEKIFKALVPAKQKKTVEFEDGMDIINLLSKNKEKIKHWIDYTLTSIKKDKRKREKFDLSGYFKNLKKSWSTVFLSKDIKLVISDKINKSEYDFRAFEMDMNTIFSNLINNSIDSFNRVNQIQDRLINISLNIVDSNIEIVYTDNGKGIDDVFEEYEEIFLPFTTTKKDRTGKAIGTGLGMYLAKNVIDDNNGTIEILEPKAGFAVKILLPLRKN